MNFKDIKTTIKTIKEVNAKNLEIYHNIGALDHFYEVHTDGAMTLIVFYPSSDDSEFEVVWDGSTEPHTKRREFKALLNDHYTNYLGLQKKTYEEQQKIMDSPDRTDIEL
jgi:hypothetical protein